MKVLTPQISWHDRQSILSVDFQNRAYNDDPFAQTYRLATGGNDSHVIVWKASFLRNPEPKKPVYEIECLAELTQHQRSVNVVRFSPNLKDNFLASGDDDSLIFIWKLCEKDTEKEERIEPKITGNVFIDSEVIAVETWKTYKILRGHNQDVSDLCWSQDGQKLVSGSVDNNVFVWDVHRGSKLHKVAKEHSSYVQGVTWDPLNLYIASLSADRHMVIFNAKNGKTVHRVFKISFDENQKNSSKLFYDQTLMSFCRRLTFSPGGELLFAPSGIFETSADKFENTVYIFERDNLNRPAFYLPTGKFSVAVKCCPIIFQLKEGVDNAFKFPYRIIFAVATQDSIIFYDSQQLLPFAYVSQVHYLRLTDISWSSDGQILIVTSTDGFSSFVLFDKDELGVPYTGKLLELNELEPSYQRTLSQKIGSAEKAKLIKPTICSTPITAYFKKAVFSATKSDSPNTPSIEKNTENDVQLIEPTEAPNNSSSIQAKPGRRISLITLFTPKDTNCEKEMIKSDTLNGAVETKCANQIETGIKRKHPENNENHCDNS